MKPPPRDLFVGVIGALTYAIFISDTLGWSLACGFWLIVCLFVVFNWPESRD